MGFETDRLILRDIEMGDLERVYALVSDPEVAQFLWMERQDSISKTEALMRDYIDNPQKHVFAVIERESGDFTGVFLLKQYDDEGRDFEITTYSAKQYWNRGYASEVLEAAKDYARDVLKIDLLTAYALEENIASNRALRRRGFELERVEYYDNCPGGLNIYKYKL